jgi:hypothetical protein
MAVAKTKRQARQPVSRRKARAKTSAEAFSGLLALKEGVKPKQNARPFRGTNALGQRSSLVEKAYVKAVKLSRRTKKPVRFVVDIHPDGAEEITRIEERPATVAGRQQGTADNSKLDRALVEARHRGQRRIAEILAGPEMLSADAFAERLGTTRATVTAWRHKNQVLGLEGATRGFRFPQWQVGEDGRPFRVIPELFDRLGGDAWTVYRFLVQRHPELGGITAKEALRQGRAGEVVETAEGVARAFA